MDLEAILQWVTAYGPAALYLLLLLGIVGLPAPDETLLVFCGYLIQRGTFPARTTWIAAAAGSICGITVSYILGRTLGLTVIHRFGSRFGATEARLEKVHALYRGVGHWALTFGYFIPGFRHFSALVAGASHLEAHTFAVFAYGGALIWVSTFLSLGYFLGEEWKRAAEHAHHLLMAASAALVVAGLGYWLWKRRKKPEQP
ncbi:MAG: hypothetical protein IANPNBLG_02216 [Bryobacteraceae bacterium]|nr:hypothetical protein [Bryobacteraceae bacterium]